jgi:hypothetical protein
MAITEVEALTLELRIMKHVRDALNSQPSDGSENRPLEVLIAQLEGKLQAAKNAAEVDARLKPEF